MGRHLVASIALSLVAGTLIASTAEVEPAEASTLYVTPSQAPQGDWVDEYGGDGYVLADWNNGSDLESLPVGVDFSTSGSTSYHWVASTSDVRALESPTSGGRKVGVWYSASSLELTLDFADTYRGTVSLYSVDWDSSDRRQTVVIDDGTLETFGDINQSFNGGAWISGQVSVFGGGSVTITVNRTGSYNALVSGIFLDAPGPAYEPEPLATEFEPQGSWRGEFGGDGYVLAAGESSGTADAIDLPSGVTFDEGSGTRYLWEDSTAEGRALQTADGGVASSASGTAARRSRRRCTSRTPTQDRSGSTPWTGTAGSAVSCSASRRAIAFTRPP